MESETLMVLYLRMDYFLKQYFNEKWTRKTLPVVKKYKIIKSLLKCCIPSSPPGPQSQENWDGMHVFTKLAMHF